MTVPEGIEVIDQRLVAHGFTAEDGVVLEGKVTDLATRQPIAATVQARSGSSRRRRAAISTRSSPRRRRTRRATGC